MPGLLPFIQIGAVSEFGQAIAQLTGLAELVDLAKHATKAQQLVSKDFVKLRNEEIVAENALFQQAQDNLQKLLRENSSLSLAVELPGPHAVDIESQLEAIEQHFIASKTQSFENAKAILGTSFDPTNTEERDNLEDNVSPALQQLSDFKNLPSAARLAGLSKVDDEKSSETEALVADIKREAETLAELMATPPDLTKRRRLYARVASWMKEYDDSDLATCKVCGNDLEHALDPKTGRKVRDELDDALRTDSELMAATLSKWASSSLGKLSKDIPEAYALEIKRDLPTHPRDLLLAAVADELFDTGPFKGALSVLQSGAKVLAARHFTALPALQPLPAVKFPALSSPEVRQLEAALTRIERAISFGSWQREHKEAVNYAVLAVITKTSNEDKPVNDSTPLGVKLAALSQIVRSAAPTSLALQDCARMKTHLKARREKERRIEDYKDASVAIGDVITVGRLAQRQVEALRAALDGRAAHWRNKIYNNAYSTSGYNLVGSDMNSKGALTLIVGSNGVSAPAQHVSNASALRASLVGFYLAFWEYVYRERGGLRLLVLDDPQELLDDDNRDRLARTLSDIPGIGAQVLVTTHNRLFARMVVAEARKADAVEHRSVHPVNEMRVAVETSPAIEELDRKREVFERNVDDASKAQDYIVEARVFIEARLADLFDDPVYPAYSSTSAAPTFATYLGRLRGLVSKPPNELFRNKLIVDFCNDAALKEGASCLALLNRAHHKDKVRITYKDVKDEADHLRRLRGRIEDVHEEFRRWKWREGPASSAKIRELSPATYPKFVVDVHPDLAAFTSASNKMESQDQATDTFDSSWFENKSFFYLKNENMGFAAPATSIVVVESEAKQGNDRNLVIAFHKSEILARRLLRPQNNAIALALAAQTPDPRKSPPTRMVDPSETQIHRVLAVLFDEVAPPAGKHEAIQIETAQSLNKVETSYRVRDDSALPLALPGQVVLGGPTILPSDLGAYEGKFVALTLMDGSSIFKRVGPPLPEIELLRQFESIGGLGASEVIAMEAADGVFGNLPVLYTARQVLGVIYEQQQ